MTGSEPDQERGVLGLTLVATELGAIFAGAILPTPLYPLYRQAFGFSAFTLTLIYAVYVLGNLLALLLFGRLSDQIGRRTVGWPAIACALASAGIFAAAFSTGWLFAARALSGFATGLASGTATAWIAELFRSRDTGAAARLAAAANFFGCAGGPLLGGLLAQFAPAPLQVPFVAYSLLLCALAAALPFARETVTDRDPQF